MKLVIKMLIESYKQTIVFERVLYELNQAIKNQSESYQCDKEENNKHIDKINNSCVKEIKG